MHNGPVFVTFFGNALGISFNFSFSLLPCWKTNKQTRKAHVCSQTMFGSLLNLNGSSVDM